MSYDGVARYRNNLKRIPSRIESLLYTAQSQRPRRYRRLNCVTFFEALMIPLLTTQRKKNGRRLFGERTMIPNGARDPRLCKGILHSNENWFSAKTNFVCMVFSCKFSTEIINDGALRARSRWRRKKNHVLANAFCTARSSEIHL